jgi:hypothetical protein
LDIVVVDSAIGVTSFLPEPSRHRYSAYTVHDGLCCQIRDGCESKREGRDFLRRGCACYKAFACFQRKMKNTLRHASATKDEGRGASSLHSTVLGWLSLNYLNAFAVAQW